MHCLSILAQAAQTVAETTPPAGEGIIPINQFWEQITSLGKLESLMFISFGVVCLFYGWRVFRILVTISFGLLGIIVGIQINNTLISGNGIWLGIIFMTLFAVLSIPLMRWAVSLLGAAAGGVITGGIWFALALPEQYIWAGALIGFIAGGMISFIIFKVAVMLFTSLGGSSLIVVGMLAVIYQYLGNEEELHRLVLEQRWFLPVILLVPMAAGIFAQYKLIKSSKNWDI